MARLKKPAKNLDIENAELHRRLAESLARETSLKEKFSTGVAGVAHDLKTPIALISGYAECLKEGMDDKDYLSLILEKTENMNNIVLTLLDAAKSENETRVNERVKVFAPDYFTRLFSKFKNLAATKNIKYSVGRIPKASVYIDPQQIERLTQNLITNAVKFTPESGKIKITAGIKNAMLAVKVRDNGRGISKENLEKIFDKFYKEDESRPLNSSNGLGLYIAKEFSENHGGSLTVKSKKEKGSAFTFSIPIILDLQNKRTFCSKFEARPLLSKIMFIFLFLPFFSCVYRLAKFFEFKRYSLLWAAFWGLALFPFFWMFDIISEILYGRITMLSD